MRSKGQIGIEYLAIIGILIFILVPIVAFTTTSISSQGTSTQGDLAVSRIASTAESVYAQGTGAKQVINVVIPESADLSQSSIDGRIIHLRLIDANGEQQDVVRVLPFNLTGQFPQNTGSTFIIVEALDNGTVGIRDIEDNQTGQ